MVLGHELNIYLLSFFASTIIINWLQWNRHESSKYRRNSENANDKHRIYLLHKLTDSRSLLVGSSMIGWMLRRNDTSFAMDVAVIFRWLFIYLQSTGLCSKRCVTRLKQFSCNIRHSSIVRPKLSAPIPFDIQFNVEFQIKIANISSVYLIPWIKYGHRLT